MTVEFKETRAEKLANSGFERVKGTLRQKYFLNAMAK